jgi:hypothetical protein
MKTYGGVQLHLHTLTSALDRDEWSASHSGHFTPGGGKFKVVPVLLTKHHAMKAYRGSGGIASLILWPRHYMEASGQLHAPAALPPAKDPSYLLDRRLSGPQSRSGRGGKKKKSQPPPESNPRSPIFQPVVQRYTDWAIAALPRGKESRLLIENEAGWAPEPVRTGGASITGKTLANWESCNNGQGANDNRAFYRINCLWCIHLKTKIVVRFRGWSLWSVPIQN